MQEAEPEANPAAQTSRWGGGDSGGRSPPKFEVRETEVLISPPISHKLPLYFQPFSGFLFTMTQHHLKSLVVSHIHQKVLDLVGVDALMKKFVLANETCASMFAK
jgi:hypothetical protein